nr:immunoglobulin light chain junction region [Macaca mulatta]MOX22133.1 immunoglobulin light chain junction region [Macaca mulatta]
DYHCMTWHNNVALF